MKKKKRWLAALLAVCMTVGIVIPAFTALAVQEDGIYLGEQKMDPNEPTKFTMNPGEFLKIPVQYLENGKPITLGTKTYYKFRMLSLRSPAGAPYWNKETISGAEGCDWIIAASNAHAGQTYAYTFVLIETETKVRTTYTFEVTVTNQVTASEHAIEVGAAEHGSAVVSTPQSASALAGTLAIITTTPDTNYGLAKLVLTDKQSGQPIDTCWTSEISFIMPDRDVVVTPVFGEKHTISGITYGANGTGNMPIAGFAGETIQINMTPDAGYMLDPASIQINSGSIPAEIVPGRKNSFTFVMPDAQITSITASFQKDPDIEVKTYQVTLSQAEGGMIVVESPADITSLMSGTKISLFMKADENYQYVSNSTQVTTASGKMVFVTTNNSTHPSFTMPAEDVTVTARFVRTYALTRESYVTTGGSIAPASGGNSRYAVGSSISILSKAGKGYQLKEGTFRINGQPVELTYKSGQPSAAYYTFTMPAYDVTSISVEYEKIPRGIEVTPSAHGTVTANPATAGVGDTVTLTVAPESGYKLTDGSLKVNNGAVAVKANTDGTYTFTMPAGDVTISAAFEKLDYDVTVSAFAGGTVASNVRTAQIGNTVTLTVSPEAGYKLTDGSLKVNNGAVTVTANADGTYTFTMPAGEVTITAAFEKVDYDVTIGTFEHGTVASDVQTAQIGDTVTLTVTQEAGYKLTDGSLKVNNGAVTVTANADGTYTFTMPAGQVTIAAAFEKVDYDVTLPEKLENGGITCDLSTAQIGDTVILTVTPKAGYKLTDGSLQVNGGKVEVKDNGDGTYSFIMPAGTVEITASFEALPTQPSTDQPTTQRPGDPTQPTDDTTKAPDNDTHTSNVDTGDAALGALAMLTLCAGAGYVLTKRRKER